MSSIHTLDIHPALGFETADRWKVAVHQRDEKLRQNGKDPEQYHHRYWGKERMVINNLAKVLILFPGLNVVTGIVRIILNINDYVRTSDLDKKAISLSHIYRGVGDIFFGPFMIVADIVKTLFDRQVVNAYLRTHPELVKA